MIREVGSSRSNARRFLAASTTSHDAFFVLESVRNAAHKITDFRFAFVNENAARLVSSTPERVTGQLLCESYPINRTGGFFEKYKKVVETGEPIEEEFPIQAENINASWLRFHVVKLDDGVAITTSNISEQKRMELQSSRAAALVQAIISSSPFATIATGLDGTIAALNPAAERMFGCGKDELIGQAVPMLFHDSDGLAEQTLNPGAQSDGERRTGSSLAVSFLLASAAPDRTEEAECMYRRHDGPPLLVNLAATVLTDPDGERSGLIFVASDITERRRIEDRISHLAHHDALTGLPTRTLLNDRLENAIERARRNQTMVALYMIDIDNFKRINDVLGHQAGDALLVAAACRLADSLRKSDTVARMGGDEFVVLLEDVHSVEEAERLAAKLVDVLAAPMRIEGHDLTISASVGVCLFPDGGDIAPLILKNADAAMYRAKTRGRNTFQVFNLDMASATAKKRRMENALLDALALDEFELVYQPQVSLATGAITGIEALLRWRSGKLGMVMPNDFIPLAEETGMIAPIGEWVLRTACKRVHEFSALTGRRLAVAVNVSPRQFEHDDLPTIIEAALAESGLDPAALEIEITENILISDSPKAVEVLDRVRALGVKIAIDDFGTGFSSMSYILRFNVDRLKIDQSFVRNLTQDPNSRAVTKAIIALAHGLKINVIAEGVETAAHRDFLIAEGCDDAQGYYYARPVPFEALEAALNIIGRSEATTASSQ